MKISTWSAQGACAAVVVLALAGGAGWVFSAAPVAPGRQGPAAAEAGGGHGALQAAANGRDRRMPGAGLPLFRVLSATARAAAPGAPVPVAVSRQAALAAARSGTLVVELPDGTRFPVRHERSESAPGGTWTFVGRVDTDVGALAAVITFGSDGVFGLLPTPEGPMLELTTRAGQVYLQPAGGLVPPGVASAGNDDVLVPPRPRHRTGARTRPAAAPPVAAARGSIAPASAAIGQQAGSSTAPVTIDVLATYTANLVALRGTAGAVETEFHNLVAVANQAHIDSGSVARFAIAGFAEIDYPAAATNHDVLYAATAGELPDGTDLHALRDAAAADLVAVIRPHADADPTCGVAWLPGNAFAAFALDPANGFSVTAVEDCAPLVLAHELGHNLGAMHDRETSAAGGTLQYGAFPYSFGYRQDGPPAFGTVMAYTVGNQAWVNRFSHPGTAQCQGTGCGIADIADAVRGFNQTAATVARFRDPPGTISVLDGRELEGDSGYAEGTVQVRLSSPAPAGGVTFDVVIESATAELGVDAEVPSWMRLTDLTIEEGWASGTIYLRITGDAEVEATESIRIRLANVRGAVSVHDAEATFEIVDDDDTVALEGHLALAPGDGAPEGDVLVYLRQVVDGVGDVLVSTAKAPDFDYAFDVARGATAVLFAGSAGRFFATDRIEESVEAPMSGIDLPMMRGVYLSGTLSFDGPEASVPEVILWNAFGDGNGYYVSRQGDWGVPSPEYGTLVRRGVPMRLEVEDPPAPYVRQIVEVPPLYADGTWDMVLRQVPSLSVSHALVVEGEPGDAMQVVQLTATLSQPAPPEGLDFELAVGGTASADDRFARAGTYRIYGGEDTTVISIGVPGDDRREPDETVVLQVSGFGEAAWNPAPGTLTIASDEPARPGDGTCTGSTTWPSVRVCQ